ncbi:hypothetical protein RRG08_040206 [Elysia crispata]|uniref:Uncharacterized protein n=1 Tax=Elysia crispata TaxID=231223 RepID=A0AAE0XXB0_9GAST|nr:hypothetical protein RRG08_040206 [Elysia crispata]
MTNNFVVRSNDESPTAIGNVLLLNRNDFSDNKTKKYGETDTEMSQTCYGHNGSGSAPTPCRAVGADDFPSLDEIKCWRWGLAEPLRVTQYPQFDKECLVSIPSLLSLISQELFPPEDCVSLTKDAE